MRDFIVQMASIEQKTLNNWPQQEHERKREEALCSLMQLSPKYTKHIPLQFLKIDRRMGEFCEPYGSLMEMVPIGA